ncbi:nitrite reductase (NAD(P)H) small subunit [Gorillibacterium massiliense]|uniref:nitrite reductase (NAD(P)H) small subunit n=1 Tax=Gorillibacterium massiliense TaxID=1280390 RepID=UPI0004B22DDE|nr:nitrite reductase (NAD(P)H) small subunit [Gorillibacterium massiliense]
MQAQEKIPYYLSAGQVDDYLPRIGRVIRYQGKEIAVFRLSGDAFVALENHNAHQKGGPLCEGIVSGDYVFDPLYNRKISLYDGKVLDSDESVATYPVRVIGSDVQIYPEA